MSGATAAVLGRNKVDGSTGERLGFNAYMRKAVTDSLLRMASHLPYVLHIGNFYEGVDQSRRSVSPELLNSPVFEFAPGFNIVMNEPNMDAYSYHAAFVNYIFLLTAKFNLCLPEIIGLICAQDFMHQTSLFFILAAKAMLHCVDPRMFSGNRPGYEFSFVFIRILLHFRDEVEAHLSRRGGSRRDFRRYRQYYRAVMPSWQDWRGHCHRKLTICLHVNAALSEPGSQDKSFSWYTKAHAMFMKEAHQVGDLGINHSMAVMSCLGLLPPWFLEYVQFKPESRPMKFYSSMFYHSQTFKKDSLDKVMRTLRSHLSSRFQCEF